MVLSCEAMSDKAHEIKKIKFSTAGYMNIFMKLFRCNLSIELVD
jgi:hypothetical protein